MPTPKFAIVDWEIDEISLVPSGDNPPARVVLSKASPDDEDDDDNDFSNDDGDLDEDDDTTDDSGMMGDETDNNGIYSGSARHSIQEWKNTPHKFKKSDDGHNCLLCGGRHKSPLMISKGENMEIGLDTSTEDIEVIIGKATLDAEYRQNAASSGEAMEDGSYPIAMLHGGPGEPALNNAIHAWGRANPSKRTALKAHLRKRAKALGASQEDMDKIDQLGENDTEVSKNEGGKVQLTEAQQTIVDALPEDAKTVVQEIMKAAETKPVEDSPDLQTLLSKADPALREYLTKADERAKKAEDNATAAFEIAKSEQTRREESEFLALAAKFPNVTGTVQEKAEILKNAYGVSSDYGNKVKGMLETTNAQLDGTESLLREIGKASPNATGTATEEVENRAQEIRKSDPKMTIEKARTLVYSANPSLYSESLKESREGSR